MLIWNPKMVLAPTNCIPRHQNPETLKWSHSRCWRLSFLVLSAALLLLLLSSVWRMLPRARPWNGSLLIETAADCMLYALSNRERHDLMGFSCNMSDLFFGRRILSPFHMWATSFISTPAFSVAPKFVLYPQKSNKHHHIYDVWFTRLRLCKKCHASTVW